MSFFNNAPNLCFLQRPKDLKIMRRMGCKEDTATLLNLLDENMGLNTSVFENDRSLISFY